jgi:N-methylhydantoinase A
VLLGVDVGGTFTDAVVYDGAGLHTAKAPTTPGDEARGVRAAVAAALEVARARPGAIERFVHGMTVGTNALLEERGARTCLVTTAGFEDVIEIGRQDRPSLYRLCAPKPRPLVDREMRIGVHERVGAAGVVTPLEDGEIDRVVEEVVRSGARAVAICLLFSFSRPEHEQRLAAAIAERLPGVQVSASHDVLPRFREFERCSTTVIDAYLSPLLGSYLAALAGAAAVDGLPEPEIMRSSGGLAPWREAARHGAWSVLSGPAGGAVGAGAIASLSAGGSAIGLDMGGTSCDVCVVEDGRVRRTEARTIGGRPIQLPAVDIHTVGAGGGSIAWRDHGGALRVGPRSAGADPGPACYGRGGTRPTVTDANVVLGRLAPDSALAGGITLDGEAARAAVAALAATLGLDIVETAAGIVRVAATEMAQAIRVVTVERGIDPRGFALLPFGGAGPLHAADVAGELEMTRIACPRAGGVLSALGLLACARRRDTARTVLLRRDELTRDRVAAEVASLHDAIRPGMEDATFQVRYELRYSGQAFELPVEVENGNAAAPDPAELARSFEAEHERRYGFRDPAGEVELVAIAVSLTAAAQAVTARAAGGADVSESTRRVYLDGAFVEARIVHGEPAAGARFAGPAVIELPETTLLLPAGWSAETDDHGTIVAGVAA